VNNFIEKNFALFWLIGGVIAYFFPNLFLPVQNALNSILMCTFFLGFLKIDLAEIIYLKNNKLSYEQWNCDIIIR